MSQRYAIDGPTLEWNVVNTNQGFSLTEVLVSLLLITGTSLTLINQQGQVSHLLNQMNLSAHALSQLDNMTECLYAGCTDEITSFQPQFKKVTSGQVTLLSSSLVNQTVKRKCVMM